MDADAGLAVIGAGAMGSALLTGIVAGGAVEAGRARVYDVVESVRDQVAAATGVSPAPTLADAVRGARVVLLCVKP
ncbi:MAG TPA: NAD(P)-binding domain-containing protein, partial [Armatimonadota bacterium]|nr:NAD(P)-binding domain-containing protein [Armatimonadota bacterium]